MSAIKSNAPWPGFLDFGFTPSAFSLSNMAPDTSSIAGYTIFREGDYDSASAASLTPRGVPHPLGMFLQDTSQGCLTY